MAEFNVNQLLNLDLTGKTVVVTGGAGVLCSTFALNLARCGAKIAILDLNEEGAQVICNEIKNKGGTAMSIKTNILDKNSLINAKNLIEKQYNSCDILINGAGGNHPRATTTKDYLFPEDINSKEELMTFLNLDPKNIQFVFDLNFIGALLTSQVFIPILMKSKNPTIINISSMNAYRPLTKIPAYSAAKAAISNFTQWLAVHLSKVNIRVNAIAPGFFLTKQNESLLKQADGTFTERARKILDHTPQRRFGIPEDLLGTLFWLVNASASGFITGVVIPVDGGFSAYSGV